jgi:hypothetical protein
MLHVRENLQKIKDAHKQFCCYENKDWLEKIKILNFLENFIFSILPAIIFSAKSARNIRMMFMKNDAYTRRFKSPDFSKLRNPIKSMKINAVNFIS